MPCLWRSPIPCDRPRAAGVLPPDKVVAIPKQPVIPFATKADGATDRLCYCAAAISSSVSNALTAAAADAWHVHRHRVTPNVNH
jgi:hypothetical protein